MCLHYHTIMVFLTVVKTGFDDYYFETITMKLSPVPMTGHTAVIFKCRTYNAVPTIDDYLFETI